MKKRILSSVVGLAALGTFAFGAAATVGTATASTLDVFSGCTSGGYYGFIAPGEYEGANMGGCQLVSGTPELGDTVEFSATASEYICEDATTVTENSDGTYNVAAGPCKGSSH